MRRRPHGDSVAFTRDGTQARCPRQEMVHFFVCVNSFLVSGLLCEAEGTCKLYEYVMCRASTQYSRPRAVM